MVANRSSPMLSPDRAKHLLILALLTVFVSNFSFYPFGTAFRFSLAVSVFVFYILINEEVNPLGAGLTTGIAIIVFRASSTYLFRDFSWWEAVARHAPSGAFYLFLGCGLLLTRNTLRQSRIEGMFILALLDTGSNVMELILRGEFFNKNVAPIMYMLTIVALARGGLAQLSLVAWRQRDHIIQQQQQQKEFERLLLITSDISGELLYLETTLAELEKIMLISYQLYNRLKTGRKENAEAALSIAREIHDAKKDFERLAARLKQVLIREREGEVLPLNLLIDVAVKSSKALSVQQGKEIDFSNEIIGNADIQEYHTLLSIINNLVGNAIEAIAEQGSISLRVKVDNSKIEINVRDSGVGIAENDLAVIFKSGYTTKFNPQTGLASTGLGLSQVKSIVLHLGGEIEVTSSLGEGSEFAVSIPLMVEGRKL
ncbi:MAG: sensor histidine kinase [bacterium]|nr:sensor histidine kinase [bacterium]